MMLNDTRAWQQFYTQGTPADIPDATTSLYDMLSESAKEYGHRVAIDFLGEETTFSQLHTKVLRCAGGLAKLGISAGDRVAIALPNVPQHVVVFFAILRLGAVVVEHNPLYTQTELRTQFVDHQAKFVIAWDQLVPMFEAMRVEPELELEHIVSVNISKALPLKMRLALKLPVPKARKMRAALTSGDVGTTTYEKICRHTPILPWRHKPLSTDLALLQYTSGTTGTPKGVMLTHKNLLSNVLQGEAWMPSFRRGEEVMYGILPMFHTFGLLVSVLIPVHLASRAVLFPNFDMDMVAKASFRIPPTFLPGVPPMYDRMSRAAKNGKMNISQVRYAISGAMSLPQSTVSAWESQVDGDLIEGYGLTECSPLALGNPFNSNRKIGSIGVPFPSTYIRIVNPEDLDVDVELGSVGELLIKGPQVFSGYWNRPNDTADTLLPGGWLRTGDLVVQDGDGFVTVVDRKKDIIITGGFNVSPTEVEEVIQQYPGVAEAAVVGLKRGSSGAESVTAVVVMQPGIKFDDTAMREHCKRSLADYKLPRSYVLWDKLPRSPIGKVLRVQVKNKLKQG